MMKTFDIASKYLKDLKVFDEKNIALIYEKYSADKTNITSNEHYRGMVFMACVYHMLSINNDKTSPFSIALEIIEAYNPIIKTDFEKYLNTTYPKIMFDIFEGIEIDVDAEMKFNIFASAYHYLID